MQFSFVCLVLQFHYVLCIFSEALGGFNIGSLAFFNGGRLACSLTTPGIFSFVLFSNSMVYLMWLVLRCFAILMRGATRVVKEVMGDT